MAFKFKIITLTQILIITFLFPFRTKIKLSSSGKKEL